MPRKHHGVALDSKDVGDFLGRLEADVHEGERSQCFQTVSRGYFHEEIDGQVAL